MMFAPPAIRRRKPSTRSQMQAAPTQVPEQTTNSSSRLIAPSSTAKLPNNNMGNTLSEPTRAAAANLIAGKSPDALAQQLAGFLQSAAAAGAANQQTAEVSSKKAMHQCRWCSELFPRKYSKERHEARKHSLELRSAAATSSASNAFVPGPAAAAVQPVTARVGMKHSSTDDQDCELVQDSQGSAKRFRVDPETNAATSSATAAATVPTVAPVSDTDAMADDDDRDSQLQEVQPIANMSLLGETDPPELDPGSMPLSEELLLPPALRREQEAIHFRVSETCRPFLLWLCSPPVTEAEKLVKARRADPKGLVPIKKNLAFIIKVLLGHHIVELPQLDLKVFTQEQVCQRLNTHLEERNSGASRIYALFLLVKKVLVFLATDESNRRREFLLPTVWNSWTLVDTICSDSNTMRKQISRNRKVLGAAQCKNLPAPPPRAAPTEADLCMPALYGDNKPAAVSGVKHFRPVAGDTPVSAAAADGPVAGHQPLWPTSQAYMTQVRRQTVSLPHTQSAQGAAAAAEQVEENANEMTTHEFERLKHGSLEFLSRPESAQDPTRFLKYLVAAVLCWGFAPRQHTLRQLRIGSSLVKKADGMYHVLMLAHMAKNDRAMTYPLPRELTPVINLYLDSVRPRLLGGQDHDYMFCQLTGKAPHATFSYSGWTQDVAAELIGRQINAHAFRQGLITSHREQGGVSLGETTWMADFMGHSVATAQDYYYKYDARDKAMEIHERMRGTLAKNLPIAAAAADSEGEAAAPNVYVGTQHSPASSQPSSSPIAAELVQSAAAFANAVCQY